MPKTFITCTQPRADEFALTIDNTFANPALIVRHIDTPKPDGDFDAVLVTSHHAKINNFPDLPIINVADGDGGIRDLDLSGYKNILYPCATEPTYIPDNCTPWHVYETYANPDFKIADDITHISVFSVKGAKVIQPYLKSHHTVLCLSQNIADIFENTDIQKLAVCTCPRYDAMKSLIAKEFEAHT